MSTPRIGHLLSVSRYLQRLAFGITLPQPFFTLTYLPSIESTRLSGFLSVGQDTILLMLTLWPFNLWSRPMTD